MPEIDNTVIEKLSTYVREQIGLNFPPNRYGELNQKLTEIAKENNFKNVEDFIEYIVNDEKDAQKKAQILASKLSIGETYFWRDRELFRTLENKILPALIEQKSKTNKSIRIWSAGSSSGEEAYSLAILLQRLLTDIKNWNITILATDINPKALEKARRGVYTEWSFRSAPKWLKPNYFSKISEKEYEIDRSIKEMVKFSHLNLQNDPYPSLTNNTNAMDLVFCRNVLMYFALDDILKISDNLYNCLVEKGILFTTASESFQYLSSRFKIVHTNGISTYQRTTEKELSEKSTKANQKTFIDDEIKIKKPLRKLRKTKVEKIKSTRNKLIKTDPRKIHKKEKSKKSLFEEAKILYEKGENKLAESILEQLTPKEQNEQSLLLLARIKANLGKLDDAKSYCEKTLEINKINPSAYYLLATIESEKGYPDEAYKAAQKSFYIDSSFIINNYMLGNFARQLGKLKESEKYYLNSIDLLKKMDSSAIVPESDGLTAGRLENIISTIIQN